MQLRESFCDVPWQLSAVHCDAYGFVAGSRDGRLVSCQLGGETLYTIRPFEMAVPLSSVRCLGDRVLATSHLGQNVYLLSPGSGEIVKVFHHRTAVDAAIVSPNGQWMASADKLGVVRMWPARATLDSAHEWHSASPTCKLMFSENNQRLAQMIAGRNRKPFVIVWTIDGESGIMPEDDLHGTVSVFAFSAPEGKMTVSGKNTGWVVIHNQGERVIAERLHDDRVTAVIMTDEGRILSAAGSSIVVSQLTMKRPLALKVIDRYQVSGTVVALQRACSDAVAVIVAETRGSITTHRVQIYQ